MASVKARPALRSHGRKTARVKAARSPRAGKTPRALKAQAIIGRKRRENAAKTLDVQEAEGGVRNCKAYKRPGAFGDSTPLGFAGMTRDGAAPFKRFHSGKAKRESSAG
jgi:hypothetical protein